MSAYNKMLIICAGSAFTPDIETMIAYIIIGNGR